MTRSTKARCHGDRGAESFLDFQIPDLAGEIAPEDAIAITQQVTRDLVKRESFAQLLAGPLGGGMRGDIEMEDRRRS